MEEELAALRPFVRKLKNESRYNNTMCYIIQSTRDNFICYIYSAEMGFINVAWMSCILDEEERRDCKCVTKLSIRIDNSLPFKQDQPDGKGTNADDLNKGIK